MLKGFRAQMPNASEQELWKLVLLSRAASAIGNTIPMDEAQIDRIVESAKSFEDICEAIIINHERPQRVPDISGIQDEIDALLSGRFSLIACSKCSYEFPLLQGLPLIRGGAFSKLGGMIATCPKCSCAFVPNSENFRAAPNDPAAQTQPEQAPQTEQKKDFNAWPPRKLSR